jgi:hypothetical protein
VRQASFGALVDQPTITAALTPWTPVQGREAQELRNRACSWKPDDPLPFGCLLDVNASAPRMLVRGGASRECTYTNTYTNTDTNAPSFSQRLHVAIEGEYEALSY